MASEKYKMFNFELPLEYIYPSNYGTAYYLKEFILKTENDSVYVVGEKGLKKCFKDFGIKVVNDYDDSKDEEGMTDSELV